MWYTFGDYTCDAQRYALYYAGRPLKVQPKVFDLLAYLIQHRDRVVARQELFDALWPEQFVSEDALERLVVLARRATGDSGRRQRVIKTVHGRGYHFVAPVEEQPSAPPGEALLSDPLPTQEVTAHPAVLQPVGAERKQVTVLSCALAALVTQTASVDPETLYLLRQGIFALAQHEVQRYEGTIQHFAEQGFLAFFGASAAQEDHAQRAVLAALGIREQLQHNRAVLTQLPGGAQTVSMAVHTGEVIVGPIGTDPRRIALAVRDTTQMVEHLLQLAEPGAIVLSDVTGPLVHRAVRLEEMGPGRASGTPPPRTVYRVLGRALQPAALGWQGRRVRRAFVGRERELATLQALLEQAANGRGQVVGLAGEPGIGKSRLLYEFRQQVRHHPYTYLAGCCVSYGQATPYLPLLDLVRQACGVTEADAADEVRTKVRLALQAVGMEPEAWEPYILRLLGSAAATASLDTLSPQALRLRTFEALIQMQLHASQQRPLVLEVEDLHWIDPTSEEWLVALIERLAGAPLLLLLSYRAGYQPTWMGKSYATQLAVQRLTAEESRRLVRAVLQARSVSEELVRTIEAKGEGNPFFLEELAQAAAEQGDAHPTMLLPGTVQAVLATRLDRLPPEAKALVQVAAVVGREVPGALLQAVTALAEVPLRQGLARLQEAEFLYEARPVSEPVYVFQHALTQEVAYQSLLRHTRQQYHRQIAEALVAGFAAVVETQPEVLAHHYTEAGLNEQALGYWQQAGQRASARSAYVEAARYCTQGLAALATLPATPQRASRELDCQFALAYAVGIIKGWGAPEVEAAHSRARTLCAQVEDTAQLAHALAGLQGFYREGGGLDTARALGEQLFALSQRLPDPAWRALAHNQLGMTLYYQGECLAARAHQEQALAHYEQRLALYRTQGGMPQAIEVYFFCHMALTLWALGYPAQALARSQQALSLGDERSSPFVLTIALYFDGLLRHLRREEPRAQAQAEEAIRLATAQGYSGLARIATCLQGAVVALQGQPVEGLAQMQQGFDRMRAAGVKLSLPRWLSLLAAASAMTGQAAAGLSLLQEARELVHKHGLRLYAAELSRLQGELLLGLPAADPTEAAASFHHALDIARRQEAKALELRAAMSLARLWKSQGKRAAARQLLAEVYDWFTEGFDTADLQEARALLNALQCE